MEEITVSEYLTTFYAICLITSKTSSFKPTIFRANLFAFEFENPSKNLFSDGIEIGCQAFIISNKAFENFLQDFHEVHDELIQVFPNKRIVVYQSEIEEKSFDDEIFRSKALHGKLHFRRSLKILKFFYFRFATHFIHKL